jgi:hypothetical protein
MALKLKLKKAQYDKLSDELKSEYKSDGEDGYTLDVDGIEDTGALRRANDRLKQENKDLSGEVETLTESNRKLESGKAGDVTKLTKKYDGDIATMKTEHGEAIAKRDGFITRTLKNGLAATIAAALNPKSPKVFVPHLESRITVDLTGDEPKVVILGADGKPSALTPEQLQQEFVANKDFAGMIVGSKASGGAGANNTNRGGAPVQNNDQQPASLATMKPGALVERIKASKEAANQ